MPVQQEFLREAADALGLTQKELAARMRAPWETFRKWLLPQESGGARDGLNNLSPIGVARQ
jgi:transcriptional regulator with XRE-family HTH domain